MHPGFTPDGPATLSFPSTRWSLVVQAAAPQARQALEELCALYWYPVYAFIRRLGTDPDRALDLTQDFFTRLLEKDILASVDKEKGRFRAFLRVTCRNFLVDTVRKKKLDVVNKALAIDVRDSEGRYLVEPADNLTPDRLFDRAWALTLLDRVLGLLAAEESASDRAELFGEIKVVLTEGKGAVRSAVLAERLKMSEGAVNTAIHRLRKRYRVILEAEIAATLDDPAEFSDELWALYDALQPESRNR
jgi:RNA polymerase sigma factor (sigma-70 family)